MTRRRTGEIAACKVIAKRKLKSADDVETLRREVAIMHHVNGHPNVVGLLGAYEDAKSVYIVMELCNGRA